MAIISMPAGLQVGGFTWGRPTSASTRSATRAARPPARSFGPPRWTLGMSSLDAMSPLQAGIWEALIAQLRGRVNHLAAYDITRPLPQGTMRGSLTLNGAQVAGDTTVVVTGGAGQAGTTLLRGDWLQLGTGLGTSQLIKVCADATANGSGVITLTTEPPLRLAFSGGTAVTYSQPLAYFKRSSARSSWQGVPGALLLGGHTLDMLEQWS
jgi:hypothetical protein